MKKKNKLFGVVILAALVLFVGIGVTKALIRQGPRQIEKSKPKTRVEMDMEKMGEWKNKTKEYRELIEKLPDFKPPEKGVLTRKQVEKYLSVRYSIQQIVKLEKARAIKTKDGKIPLKSALRTVNRTVALGNMMEARALAEQNMSYEELKWVENNFNKGAVLATLRAYEDCYDSDARPPEVENIFKRTVVRCGYYTLDEKQNRIPDLSKIDPAEIPEANYTYFLEYLDWFDFDGFNVKKIDFGCLIEKENIQPPAFTLPEITHPEPLKDTLELEDFEDLEENP